MTAHYIYAVASILAYRGHVSLWCEFVVSSGIRKIAPAHTATDAAAAGEDLSSTVAPKRRWATFAFILFLVVIIYKREICHRREHESADLWNKSQTHASSTLCVCCVIATYFLMCGKNVWYIIYSTHFWDLKFDVFFFFLIYVLMEIFNFYRILIIHKFNREIYQLFSSSFKRVRIRSLKSKWHWKKKLV